MGCAHTLALTAFGNTNNVARDAIMPRTSDAAHHLQWSATRRNGSKWQLKGLGSKHEMRTAQRSAQNNGWPHIQTPSRCAVAQQRQANDMAHCRSAAVLSHTRLYSCERHHSVGPQRGVRACEGAPEGTPPPNSVSKHWSQNLGTPLLTRGDGDEESHGKTCRNNRIMVPKNHNSGDGRKKAQKRWKCHTFLFNSTVQTTNMRI